MPDMVRDPVCGMEIGSRLSVATAVSEERRFHFCCLRCYAAFLDTPHSYVGWVGRGEPADTGPTGKTATNRGPEPCHFES
jgi:YHS domain-containing protein